LLIDMTSEGLRIQIVDQQNRPMFANASAEVQPYMRTILRELGAALNDVPNPISLSGHTDATQYATQHGYSNWELSADRANASRRELVAGGMQPEKVSRVVGLEASVALDKTDPYNPINRRISIVVLNEAAEENFLRDGQQTPSQMPGAEASLAPAPEAFLTQLVAQGAITAEEAELARLIPVALHGAGLPALDPSDASVRLVAQLSHEDFGANSAHFARNGVIEN